MSFCHDFSLPLSLSLRDIHTDVETIDYLFSTAREKLTGRYRIPKKEEGKMKKTKKKKKN